MRHKLALDFGTTNTLLARWDAGANEARLVELPGLSAGAAFDPAALVPSLLYVRDGRSTDIVAGQAVRQERLDWAPGNRLFHSFKRGLVSSPAPEPRLIDGTLWTDREAGRSFLRRLLRAAAFRRDDVDQLVMTAPVAAFDAYLLWLRDALDDIPADRIRVVDESTAAALGYAVTDPGALVLVIDFGGGTLDLALVQLPESRDRTGRFLDRLWRPSRGRNTARVLGKAGRALGGSDIDRWLLAEVLKRAGLAAGDVSGEVGLLALCEQAKIALSTAEEAVVKFQAGGWAHAVRLTRPELESLLETHGFYATLRHVVDQTLHEAQRRGVFLEDLAGVLLVGGVSLMPSVQAQLRRFFGRTPVRAGKPFTAIVEGALQLALGLGLDDYLVHGYGLRHLDPSTGRHQYEEVIPMGRRCPIETPIEIVLGAAHPGQTEVELVIGEIGGDAVSRVDVIHEDGDVVFVAPTDAAVPGVVSLSGPPVQVRLDPPGTPGEDRLKAAFTVDDERRLCVTVTDLQTNRELLQRATVATLRRGMDVESDSTPAGREPRLAARHVSGRRRLSLRGLGTMLNLLPPQAVSLEAAAAALRSRDFFVRYSAARLLARRGDREARLVLQSALVEAGAPARASAARELYSFSWFSAEPLIRQALDDEDTRVRQAAVYALCDMRNTQAYRLLAERLQNEDDDVRDAAAWGLRECRDPEAVLVLRVVVLRAAGPAVRVRALEALGANGSPEALPVARAQLEDPDADVKYAATLSWLELAGAASLPELAGVIQRESGLARQQVLRGFFHATNYLAIDVTRSSAIDAMLDALECAARDDLPGARQAAAWPLAWIRHERAARILRAAYEAEPDETVKAHIVCVAVGLMSEAAGEILADALQSESASVREAAERMQLAARHRRVEETPPPSEGPLWRR